MTSITSGSNAASAKFFIRASPGKGPSPAQRFGRPEPRQTAARQHRNLASPQPLLNLLADIDLEAPMAKRST